AGLGSGTGPLGLARQAFRVAAAVEIQILRNRGAHVRHVGPDGAAPSLVGANLRDPGPAQRVLAAGFRQGRALAAASGGQPPTAPPARAGPRPPRAETLPGRA